MKLGDYLTWKFLTPEAFAEELNVDAVSVRRYVSGKRRPRWGLMALIAEKTEGHVTANDFAPEAKKKPKRPKARVPRKEATAAAA